MPMLIWVLAGRTLILLVLSCRVSFYQDLSLLVDGVSWLSLLPSLVFEKAKSSQLGVFSTYLKEETQHC